MALVVPVVLMASGVACGGGSVDEPATAGTAADTRAAATTLPTGLWVEAIDLLPETAQWTNKVELADLDGDGRLDILFANGGNYSEPGELELNRVFLNGGPGRPFVERSEEILGPTPDISRVIKARDINGDGHTDIFVGTTYQTQSRLLLGTGGGMFEDRTATHLPQVSLSIGDAEFGDADGDGDLDLVLADWGPGNNMSNAGGRTRLWLNDGAGVFTDATDERMPEKLIRFSWDLEFVDVDNDFDLDILVSCKRCGGSSLFVNDGSGTFTEGRGMPQYTNNYDFEAMDLDGDGFLDLVTINDGNIVNERGSSRREHVFRNNGEGRFVDATDLWWPDAENIGEDDNIAAFLDYDADGDADFVIGSLFGGPDRLMINDGSGHLTVATEVFVGTDTPGTLGMALGDLDGDGRMDVVQAQGEHRTAIQERVFLGSGLAEDTAAPVIGPVVAQTDGGGVLVRARIHDHKSPSLATEWRRVTLDWATGDTPTVGDSVALTWYGEYLWFGRAPAGQARYRVCAADSSGNQTCVDTVLDGS